MKTLTIEQQAKSRTRREFQELGFSISFRFDSQRYNLDQALDHWIEFVESQGWGFGGGGGEGSDILSGYLASFERGTLGEADRDRARQWLGNQPGFACIQCAELSDAWHSPWEE